MAQRPGWPARVRSGPCVCALCLGLGGVHVPPGLSVPQFLAETLETISLCSVGECAAERERERGPEWGLKCAKPGASALPSSSAFLFGCACAGVHDIGRNTL